MEKLVYCYKYYEIYSFERFRMPRRMQMKSTIASWKKTSENTWQRIFYKTNSDCINIKF